MIRCSFWNTWLIAEVGYYSVKFFRKGVASLALCENVTTKYTTWGITSRSIEFQTSRLFSSSVSLFNDLLVALVHVWLLIPPGKFLNSSWNFVKVIEAFWSSPLALLTNLQLRRTGNICEHSLHNLFCDIICGNLFLWLQLLDYRHSVEKRNTWLFKFCNLPKILGNKAIKEASKFSVQQ